MSETDASPEHRVGKPKLTSQEQAAVRTFLDLKQDELRPHRVYDERQGVFSGKRFNGVKGHYFRKDGRDKAQVETFNGKLNGERYHKIVVDQQLGASRWRMEIDQGTGEYDITINGRPPESATDLPGEGNQAVLEFVMSAFPLPDENDIEAWQAIPVELLVAYQAVSDELDALDGSRR